MTKKSNDTGSTEQNQTEGDSSVEIQRRKILNRVVVGASVAAATPASSSWTRPIINTVVLPAHSQMSGTTTCYFVLTQIPGPMTLDQNTSLGLTTIEPPFVTILVCSDGSDP